MVNKSVFNINDNNEFIERINKLSPQSKALWGKLDVSQMFVHLQIITKVTLGELKLKRGLLGILSGTIAKKVLINNKPFPKNLMTDKSFVVVEQKQFEEEKNKLIFLIKKFPSLSPDGLSQSVHPVFGKLTFNEWDTLQWKHVDHHLRQFGV
jgi:hypothetical protein